MTKQVPVRQLHKIPKITTFIALLGATVLGSNMMVAANAITYDQDAEERAALCYVREYGKTGAHCEAGFVNRQTKDVSSYSWGFSIF